MSDLRCLRCMYDVYAHACMLLYAPYALCGVYGPMWCVRVVWACYCAFTHCAHIRALRVVCYPTGVWGTPLPGTPTYQYPPGVHTHTGRGMGLRPVGTDHTPQGGGVPPWQCPLWAFRPLASPVWTVAPVNTLGNYRIGLSVTPRSWYWAVPRLRVNRTPVIPAEIDAAALTPRLGYGYPRHPPLGALRRLQGRSRAPALRARRPRPHHTHGARIRMSARILVPWLPWVNGPNVLM
jgi:hypothetical protein